MKEFSNEFSNIDFGDTRLNNRFVSLVDVLSARPDETINKSIETLSVKKAAYRLISNQKFTSDIVLNEHRENIFNKETNLKYLLAIHDTTFFSFNHKPSIVGLGNIGGENTRGFAGHYTLAIEPDGTPLGLLNIASWSRAYESPWEVESERWNDSIFEAEKQNNTGAKLVHVADREADIFNLHYENLKNDRLFIVRCKHDRIMKNGDFYLYWHINKQKEKHISSIYYARKRSDIPAKIKYGTVELHDPNKAVPSSRKIEINFVEICSTEKVLKEGGEEKELRWILFTNLPVNNYGDAQRVINYYRQRWQIEEFFRVLKGGACNVEKASLRSFERLDKYITVMSVISLRIFRLRHLAEKAPDMNYRKEFSEDESYAIAAKLGLVGKPIDLKTAVWTVAKMGGFNGRPGDGHPGPRSLYRGMLKLEGMAEMVKIFREEKRI
jgi:hypothetical protein